VTRIASIYGFLFAAVSVGQEANSARIVGQNSSPECAGGGVVWAVTTDCRISYRTAIDSSQGFVIEKIPAGDYRIIGVCLPAFSAPSPPIHVHPGETAAVSLNVRLWDSDGRSFRPSIPLHGRILDETGRPVGGATVTVRRDEGGCDESDSGPDGGFGFCSLLPGRFALDVQREGYRSQRIKVTLDPRRERVLDIRLHRR
jgi:hypothetical protein